MPPNQVTKIGKYDVLGVLGQGGMGVVYKGVDARIGRPVAIKMMTSGFAKSEDALRRFYREAQSVGVLQHPNIVIVYDLGDEDGTPYLVMEFLNGEPLDHIIASRRELSIVEKLDIVTQVLHALNYAHQHKIIHRDVKPGNVMVMPDGQCKLVDFGIARGGDTTLTHTGQIIGSMSYMSPEQLNGRDVDGRTDIWSAAVVLYELLSGHLPFEAREPAAMIVKILNEPPPPLSTYLPNYPAELDDILNRALCKDREERYHNADDFAFDLAHVEELLKAQMVSEYVEQARSSISGSDLGRARELLSRVLKVDTQNPTAKQLLYEVQQLIHKQQRGEQVQALRSRAEDALSKADWEEALSLADQALKIDKTNLDLLGLRESILQRKARKEQVLKLVHLAEAAQHAGELDMARRAVDDALALDPNDTQAKVLSAVLRREIEQRQRFESLLKSVRGEAASGHFTQAAQLLKEAEALRPQAPEIPPLKSLITAGREEQLRRERLTALKAEAEQLLGREQFVQAQAKAEEALRYDPGDHGVLDLLERAKTLQQNRWVEQQLGAADKLVADGRITAAITLLETAASHFQDPRLQAKIPTLRQKHQQQKLAATRAAAVSSAREAMQRQDYAGAIAVLERARSELGRSTEIEDLLSTVRRAATEAARRKQVAEVLQGAHSMLDHAEFEDAQALLEKALASGLQDPSLEALLRDARQDHIEFKAGIERAIANVTELLAQQRADDAVALLEGQPQLYNHSLDFRLLLDRVRAEQKRQHAITAALEETSEAMRRGDLEQAWQLAQGCRARYGEASAIGRVITDIEAERARRAREAAEHAAAEARNKQIEEVRQHARSQIEQGELEPAIAFLESVASQLKDEGVERLLAQARAQLAQFSRGVESAVAQARNLLDAHKPGEAIAFLQSQPELYRRSPACRALLEHANAELQQQRSAAEARHRRVQETLQQARTLLAGNEFDSTQALLEAADIELHDESLRRLLADVRMRRQEFEHAVEAIIGKARNLLDQNHAEQALALLTSQPQGYARNENFLSALREAQARAGRQHALAAAVAQARTLSQQGHFDDALAQVEAGRAQFGDAPEFEALLHDIQKQHEAHARSEVEHALDQAQLLLKAGRHDEAAAVLNAVAAVPAGADKLTHRLEKLRTEIAEARARAEKAAAERFAKGQADADRLAAQFAAPTPSLSATVLISSQKMPTPARPAGVPPSMAAAAPQPAVQPEPAPLPATPAAQPAFKMTVLLAGAVALGLALLVGLYVLLRPTAEIDVSFEAEPAGSEISVGRQLCATPCDLKLKAGNYKLNARHEGFEPFEKQITVDATSHNVSVKLAPARAAVGSVQIDTNVDQVDISVDGSLKGVTEGKRTTLTLLPGTHEIRAERRGYQPAVRNVEVAQGAEVTVSFALMPGGGEQPLRDPYLIVKAQPGAQVLVDRGAVGNVQADGTYSLQVKPGRHRVELALNGYEPWSTNISAKAGDSVPINANLKAIAKPPVAIVSFAASAGSVEPGAATELRWQTRNATEVSIDHGVGSVQPSGSRQVNPTASTTYTLTARGEGQPAQSSITITVAAVVRPSIMLFDSGADRIQPGQSVKLSWATQNAAEVSIDQGIGTVGASGSREVKPTKSTTYVLTAKGAGGSVTKSIQIAVEAAAVATPAPPPPAVQAENPDVKAIREAIEQRYKDAYESMTIDEMQRIWIGMSKQQKEGLSRTFKMFKAIKARYSCNQPSIEGEAARCSCTETVTYTTNDNKREGPVNGSILFEMKKSSGVWYVQNRRGQ